MVFPALLSFRPVSIPIVHGFKIGADGSGTNGTCVTARRGFPAAVAVASSMAAGVEVGGKVGGLVA